MNNRCENLTLGVLVNLLQSFITILNEKDHYTEQHSERVKEYSAQIAKTLGMDDDAVECCRYAGLMHDIGKIGISADILNKAGPLRRREIAIMRRHPLIGEIFLSNGRITKHILRGRIRLDSVLKILARDDCCVSKKIRETAFSHHERFNGRGYPRKLKGKQIPVTATILGIADSIDAMTTHRPYRPRFSLSQAIEKLSSEQKEHGLFDPEVFDAFLRSRDGVVTVYMESNRPAVNSNKTEWPVG
ncbi:MAG: HD domain-containing protein [Chitinispirillaceae bacterium]|nr:HD domain-containing protein [Chitinispirillaceae bacterium]